MGDRAFIEPMQHDEPYIIYFQLLIVIFRK